MLSSQYPYYGPLGSGNYNVSLAFFGPTSEISKSLGLESSTGLALPNTDFLQKFSQGDLGISDSFIKEMFAKNINNPISQNDPDILKQFISLNNIDIDIEKYKVGNRINVPASAIKVPESMQMTGFKAFEKTALQSIFETQKPFMEIVKIAIGSTAKSEDIIARVMPLLGNPLKTKSRKPAGNSGNSSRPKAIGYKKAEQLNNALSSLSSIELNSKLKGVKVIEENIESINNAINNEFNFTTNSYWKTLSTIYSTGKFDPKLEYIYSYINLPADTNDIENNNIELEQEIEYDKYKPKSLIFGIYDSKGMVLNPNEYLKTTGLFGNNSIEIETPFKKASWIFNSPKWKLPEDIHEWPAFSSPNYVWENKTLVKASTKISKVSPGNGYKIKKYKRGEVNIITGEIAVVGTEVINNFDNIEKESYRNYYNDLIRLSLDDNIELNNEEKEQAFKDVNEILDINPQLEAVYTYGHTKASIYNKISGKKAYPDALKKSYRPFEIFVPESQKDEKLNRLAAATNKRPGYIWIDPEADYDLKVVRIDPKTLVEYKNGIDSELKIGKLFFVKNRVNFLFSNNKEFNIRLSKNNTDDKIINNIKEYSFENWNYENNKIINTNVYNISVWTDDAPKKYDRENYKWSNGIKTEAKVIRDVEIVTTKKLLKWNEIDIKWKDLHMLWNNISKKEVKENIVIKNVEPEKKWVTLTKNNDKWYYNSDIKNGIITLQDGTTIHVEDSIVKKWYYIYNTDFKGPNTNYNLPSFGTERNFIINYENENIDIKDKSISLFKLRVENSNSSVLINPEQITNDFLTSPDIFIKDPQFYGTGSEDDPQTLGIINRYALTDLDKESYYIVEGILKTENEFETDDDGNRKNNGRGKGGGWYRITHALGASGQFSKLLTDIITKLIPKIVKLLKLLKNPSTFISDIISEVLSKNYEFLSMDAISTFQKSISIKEQISSQNSGIDTITEKINDARLENTILSKKILNDARGKSNIEFLQAEKMSLDIMKRGEQNIVEMEKILNIKKSLSKKLTNFYKNSILSNYAYVDEKTLDVISPLDGSAIIPLSLFGTDLSFGVASNMSKTSNKLPITLVFKNDKIKFNNVQFLIDNSKPKLKNIYQPLYQIKKNELIDLNNPVTYQIAQLNVKPPQINYSLQNVNIKFEDGSSTSISNSLLDNFIKDNSNKYNFIYVTEIFNKELSDIDTLLESGTQQDLDIVKEKLDNLKKNYPNDSIIDDKFKELNKKNHDLSKNTQPLLKALLGFVTFPIKIVADIIQWMLNFFKSITNPMKLASKMKEFLSFKWISQFLTPKGILEIFGLKFNVSNVGIADMSQFLDVNFITTLPTYAQEQLKDLSQQPLRLLTVLKLMQKIINAVIDFIWSLFGIEALMKSPHIKILPTDIDSENIKNIENIKNYFNNNSISSELNIVENYETLNDKQMEVYEVELPDGTIKSYFTKNELNTFIKDNPELNFDFIN